MNRPTVKDIVKKTTDFFTEKGIESARLDSEILIARALGWERLQVFLKFDYPLTDDELERCRESVRRRARGEPVAYIIGEKGFYKNTFKVSPAVLIPRPETELLVDEAVRHFPKFLKFRLADLGTGSGCLGLSIAAEWLAYHQSAEGKSLDLHLVDLSGDALEIAKQNAESLGLLSHCQFHCADAGTWVENQSFDMIVANPPYIDPSDTRLEPSVKEFEPATALFAGASGAGGLAEIQSWAAKTYQLLSASGVAIFEIGDGQGGAVISIFKEVGFEDVRLAQDLSGRERMIVALKEAANS